ncbi:cytochrome P450 [Tricladium varicosporioides]|nr:cytochrome P450 [Hymenoscyphus varicosporioides]
MFSIHSVLRVDSLPSVLTWVFIVVVGVLLIVVIQEDSLEKRLSIKKAFLTPLHEIPGPWYAKFTNLVLKKHVVVGQRLLYIHSLHQQHGAIVRIAPNEIDIADPEVYKEIHKIGGGFLKDPWYQSFRQGDTTDVFSMIDPKEHSERRKLFAPLWTSTALHTNWEEMVAGKVKLAVAKIRKDALANQYTDDLEIATKVGGALAEFSWIRPILNRIPLKRIHHLVTADNRVQEYGRVAVINAKESNLTKANVFSKIIAENEKDGLTDYQVAYEAGGFIVAGSGTTAITLTYLVWAVLNDYQVQRQLEEEVAKLELGFTDSKLGNLPYLNATIEETLRLYGAAPGSLPRRPPKGGAILGGYFIPEGTTVSSQAYTLHRDGNVYPNPEIFNPSRFIAPNGAYEAPKHAFAPFGAGSRTCLGMHLARMELRLGAAEFFRECRGARVADSMKVSEMEILNFFLISPAGGRCCITLTP